MPFSRQIRSNSTSTLPFPNRPVNAFPLSVSNSRGTPYVRSASAKCEHTERESARDISPAQTMNRE